MPYRIIYTPTSLDHLKDLSARTRAEVVDAIRDQLPHQPEEPTRNRKRLRPNPLGPWELRVGDARVFYEVATPAEEGEEASVVILAVGIKEGHRLRIGGEDVQL